MSKNTDEIARVKREIKQLEEETADLEAGALRAEVREYMNALLGLEQPQEQRECDDDTPGKIVAYFASQDEE